MKSSPQTPYRVPSHVRWVCKARTLAVVAVLAVLAACGGDVGVSAKTTAPPVPVLTTVMVTLSASSIEVGQTATASASGLDQDGEPISLGTVMWSTGSGSGATVSATGVVTATAAGQTAIIATVAARTGQQMITIVQAAVATVVVAPSSANVAIGSTMQYSATVRDAGGNTLTGRLVTWSSSDSTVARVNSATGLTTAVAAGSATITAVSENKTATATLTVPPRPMTLKRVEGLVPGATATLFGYSLAQATTMVVDGSSATITQRVDTMLKFVVPVWRPCETDGRTVRVVVNNSVYLDARLSVTEPVQLKVGESRVLAATTARCVQLPAANQDFVLSVTNMSRKLYYDTLFTFRTYTDQGDTSLIPVSGVAASVSANRAIRSASADPQRGRSDVSDSFVYAQHTARALSSYTLFDPRLQTGGVGDTVRMVDWDARACNQSVSSAPSYAAVIAALRGKTVILADQRDPLFASVGRADVRSRLDSAAGMLERLTVPALRGVFDSAFEVPGSAGGRHFLVMTTLPPGYAGMSDNNEFAGCALASGIMISRLSFSSFSSLNFDAPSITRVGIHEQGHQADFITRMKLGVRVGGWGWEEGWAQEATEYAARLSVGTAVGAYQPGNMLNWALTWHNSSGGQSLWGSGSGNGNYQWMPSMLLFAMEKLGLAGFAPANQTLFQRLARDANTMDGLARELGVSTDSLVARLSLAAATDDAFDPGVAEALGVAGFSSWDYRFMRRSAPEAPWAFYTLEPVSFRQPTSGYHSATAEVLGAAGGGYQAWYFPYGLPGMSTSTVKGMSIAIASVHPEVPTLLRLTRVR